MTSSPSTWATVKMVDLQAAQKYSLNGGPFGSKLVSRMYVDSGVPVIRGVNLPMNARFCFDGLVFVTEEKADELSPNIAKPGDIIFTQRGTLGQVGIIPDHSPHPRYVISQSQMKLTVDRDKADAPFIYYLFRAPETVHRITSLASSSGVPHINLESLRSFEIRLPPLNIQRRIASILSVYDDLIENNVRRIEILDEMARRLYEEWFVHFRFPGHEEVNFKESELGRIPEGWDIFQLSEVSEYISRGISPKYAESDCRVINQKCIRDHRLNMSLSREQIKKVPETKYVRFGDVLINSTGVGTLGRVAQVYESLENVTVDSHVTIVRPFPEIDLDFFGVGLQILQPYFEGLGVGATGQTELSRVRVGESPVIIPPAKLQKKFGELVEPMRRACVKYSAKNANLRAQRDLLLPKLVSGEIDVADIPMPDDKEVEAA